VNVHDARVVRTRNLVLGRRRSLVAARARVEVGDVRVVVRVAVARGAGRLCTGAVGVQEVDGELRVVRDERVADGAAPPLEVGERLLQRAVDEAVERGVVRLLLRVGRLVDRRLQVVDLVRGEGLEVKAVVGDGAAVRERLVRGVTTGLPGATLKQP
jgi:hypothetical protein